MFPGLVLPAEETVLCSVVTSCVCVCVRKRERERKRERVKVSGVVGSGCDPLKLHCYP